MTAPSSTCEWTALSAPDFDLEQTLCCGQSFRWKALSDGFFEGVAGMRHRCVGLQNGLLMVKGDGEESFWRNYFDLDTDYGAMREIFCRTPVLADVCRHTGGIRILRQDGWEALASFILSQNNNIRRICGIIERLCACFGEPLGPDAFAFPTPQRLARCTAEDLAPIRCGFRARYLIDAAQKVCSGDVRLDELSQLPLPEARSMLLRIAGVGPKVADCALLFGFYRLECFPVDVWIARAMKELLPGGLPDDARPYAGVIQQMLFHYMRTCRR